MSLEPIISLHGVHKWFGDFPVLKMIKEVLDVMIELAQEGMTMLCVTHEMGFARTAAHRIIFMDGGEIIEENEPNEFFAQPQTERAQLFLSQIL